MQHWSTKYEHTAAAEACRHINTRDAFLFCHSSLGPGFISQHITRTGPFLTGLSSWELGIQAFLFLNPQRAMAGEAFAKHAEGTRDWHVPLNTATAEGPLGSALLLADWAKALPQAAEKHLCFPGSYLQDLGTQPRPTLTFPSQASRKIMFLGRGAGIEFASSLHPACGPHLDQCVIEIWMETGRRMLLWNRGWASLAAWPTSTAARSSSLQSARVLLAPMHSQGPPAVLVPGCWKTDQHKKETFSESEQSCVGRGRPWQRRQRCCCVPYLLFCPMQDSSYSRVFLR